MTLYFKKLSYFALFLINTIAHSQDKTKDYRIDFTINDPKSDEVYYKGYEDIKFKDNMVDKKTYYFDLNDKQVQTEFVMFTKDDLVVKSYDYQNELTGEMSYVRTEKNKIKIRYRPPGGKEKSGEMTWEDQMYHGKTFHQLILRNWAPLTQGKDFEFTLLIPYRFESLGFKIKRKDMKKSDNKTYYTFSLEPQNFIIKQLAPDLEAVYEGGSQPKIKSFYGPTTLPIKGEADRMVLIKFNY